MPLVVVPNGRGAMLTDFRCEDCGGPAQLGLGAKIRPALDALGEGREAEARRLGGRWYCGARDGEPACVADVEAPQMALF